MRISPSKSEAMFLDLKKVVYHLQVPASSGVFWGLLREGRMEHEIDTLTGAVAAEMWSMYRSVVVKKGVLIYQSMYISTLTYCMIIQVARLLA